MVGHLASSAASASCNGVSIRVQLNAARRVSKPLARDLAPAQVLTSATHAPSRIFVIGLDGGRPGGCGHRSDGVLRVDGDREPDRVADVAISARLSEPVRGSCRVAAGHSRGQQLRTRRNSSAVASRILAVSGFTILMLCWTPKS